MEPALLGLILDSSIVIEAERKRQTVEEFLTAIQQRFGEIEVAVSAVTIAEMVHGVERARTPEIRWQRRAFIDELKRHVPVYPVTERTGELAGTLSGRQGSRGIKLSLDDLLIGVAALENGYAITTRNERHFRNIPGLMVVQF